MPLPPPVTTAVLPSSRNPVLTEAFSFPQNELAGQNFGRRSLPLC
jgi:hypothetical protein